VYQGGLLTDLGEADLDPGLAAARASAYLRYDYTPFTATNLQQLLVLAILLVEDLAEEQRAWDEHTATTKDHLVDINPAKVVERITKQTHGQILAGPSS
jgi:hypothetical protein